MFANDFKRAIYLGRTPRLMLDLTKATPLGETCMSPSSFLKKGKQLKKSLKRTSVNFPGLKRAQISNPNAAKEQTGTNRGQRSSTQKTRHIYSQKTWRNT